MKRASAAAILLLTAASLSAQAPGPADSTKLLALVREVQDQQALIRQNQEKIDTQLATVSELVRQARIFSARGR